MQELKYPAPRKQTRAVRIGGIIIGGNSPITVQSMTKTATADIDATVAQISSMQAAGCDIVRLAVPDSSAAEALGEIKRQISIPLVADIHFNYRLALIALAQGVDKLRLNPGNLRHQQDVREVVAAARERQVPIRIGVNNGSINPQIRAQFPFTPIGNARALVANALEHITILEQLDYHEIVVSLKASDIITTIYAYRMMAEERPYPLHIGVTEAGLPAEGLIKSGIGIGQLLGEGIGDTLRVSLTADPLQEVEAGWEILRSLNLRTGGISITACPTCGRCNVDLPPLGHEVKKRLSDLDKQLRLAGKSLHIALMGCEVNGPGEASDADLGIACGKQSGTLFRHGKIIKKIPESEIVSTICEEAKLIITAN